MARPCLPAAPAIWYPIVVPFLALAMTAADAGAAPQGAVVPSSHASPDLEAEVAWERLADGPDRAGHGMVYDSTTQSLWSFGGVEANVGSDKFHNSVYRLDLAQADPRWQLLVISGLKPPPLAFHSVLLDEAARRLVVYGGLVDRRGSSTQPANGNDVWFFDISDPEHPAWSRVSVPGNGTRRFLHAAVMLPDHQAMVISGGFGENFSDLRGDSFALLLGETPMRWQRLANAGLTPRAGHALAYQADKERLVAYGGFTNPESNSTTGEIRVLDVAGGLPGATTWMRLTPTTPSLPRAFMAAAFDPQRGLLWVQGGFQGSNSFLQDLSVLDLTGARPVWTRTGVVHTGPLTRFFHAAAWDGDRQRAVFQGGTPDNQVTLRDTRALNVVFPAAATATATTTATASATATATASPTPTATSAATATPPNGATATASVMPPTATPTIASTATATVSATNTTAPRPLSPLYLPMVVRDYVMLQATATATAPPTAISTATVPGPTATASPTPPGGAMQVLGQEGGESTGVAFAGGVAYLGIGPRVYAIDVDDPTAPSPLGRTDMLPGVVGGVAIAGGLVYAAVGPRGLWVGDASDPKQIAEVGTVSLLGQYARRVRVEGQVAWVVAGTRLFAVDVADSTAPAVLGSLSLGRTAVDLGLAGGLAAVVTTSDLVLVNVADPAALAEVARLEVNRPQGVALAGDTALVAGDDGLAVVDVADPAAPALVGALALDRARSSAVAVQGSVAYVARGFQGLHTVDITDPTAPALLGTAATAGASARDVVVAGGLAYVADGPGGLRVIDVADATSPAEAGGFAAPGRSVDVALVGDAAVLANNLAPVTVMDVSDPREPAVVSAIAALKRTDGLASQGTFAYAADGIRGLQVIDLAAPAAPVERGRAAVAGNFTALAVASGRAFLSDFFAGLLIADVSDPDTPVVLSTLETPGSPADVAVSGSLVLVADRDGGLLVISATDPAAPVVVGTLSLTRPVVAVAAAGDLAFVADDGGSFHVADVSNPAAPVLLGSLDLQSSLQAVVVQDGRAYVTSIRGLDVVDVTDPGNPAKSGAIDLVGRSFGVAIRGDVAYVAGDAGLVTVRLPGP